MYHPFILTSLPWVLPSSSKAQQLKIMSHIPNVPDPEFIEGSDQNTKPDSAAIVNTLEENYFKGLYEGDVSRLSRIFNRGTLLFGDINGQDYARTLDQYLDNVAIRQSPKDSGKDFKGEVLSVDVVNSIAVAKVRVKMYDFNYVDLLSFHKLNGQWLIVNKMLSNTQEKTNN
jgi:hypothetical protein